jgi:hypothetical protein
LIVGWVCGKCGERCSAGPIIQSMVGISALCTKMCLSLFRLGWAEILRQKECAPLLVPLKEVVCQHELCNLQVSHVRNQEYARINSAGQEERNIPFSCDISFLYYALMISTADELWGPVEGQWKGKDKPPPVHDQAPPVLLAIRGWSPPWWPAYQREYFGSGWRREATAVSCTCRESCQVCAHTGNGYGKMFGDEYALELRQNRYHRKLLRAYKSVV